MLALTPEGASEHIVGKDKSRIKRKKKTKLPGLTFLLFCLFVCFIQQTEPFSFIVFNKLHTVSSNFWAEVQQGKTAKAGQVERSTEFGHCSSLAAIL